VSPAYFQTTWFLYLTIAVVAGVVWGAHRLRLRIVEKHQSEISALNERLMKASCRTMASGLTRAERAAGWGWS